MLLEYLPPTVGIEKVETRAILKALTSTRAALAELKGVAGTIPNEQILVDTLSLQEAKDSSAIENIVTTHDELYQGNEAIEQYASAASKEVYRYAKALKFGFNKTQKNGFIAIREILKIQEIIEGNDAGIRKVSGTVLKNDLTGEVVYTPPQDYSRVMELMSNLEKFINDEIRYDVDPLVKMALIHHQFESIHPFFDGNGRTGRIINILYLIKEGLLDLPILYMSRYIIKNRQEYYSLLQSTRESGDWETWILYILKAVKSTSKETVQLIRKIKSLMLKVKNEIRNQFPKIYSQDLINNLFRHPYTKIELVQNDLQVSRLTATKYLNQLVGIRVLSMVKIGRTNYYINRELFTLLQGE